MMALMRMRLIGYAVTGRALAPLLAGLVVLGSLYGGGQSQAGDAYGVSSAVILPVLAWQTKMLLDVEPDVQRRLAAISVGSRDRECGAGLLAAAAAAIPVIALALLAPWILDGITGPLVSDDPSMAMGVALGIWAHLLLIPCALAIGAWASRAVTRTAGMGVTVLAVGTVGVIVFSRDGSPVAWLAPPVMEVARYCSSGGGWQSMVGLTGWTLLWTSVAMVGYAAVRRVTR